MWRDIFCFTKMEKHLLFKALVVNCFFFTKNVTWHFGWPLSLSCVIWWHCHEPPSVSLIIWMSPNVRESYHSHQRRSQKETLTELETSLYLAHYKYGLGMQMLHCTPFGYSIGSHMTIKKWIFKKEIVIFMKDSSNLFREEKIDFCFRLICVSDEMASQAFRTLHGCVDGWPGTVQVTLERLAHRWGRVVPEIIVDCVTDLD